MELTFPLFALGAAAVTFAGVSKGGFGSGASFAAAPLLALILDPRLAMGLLMPLLMLMDIVALWPFWRKWHWPSARAMLLGAVPGAAMGVLLWRVADPDLFRLLIGTISLAFVGWQIGNARGWLAPPRRAMTETAGIGLGAAAAFTSFVSHAGGPLAAVYLLSRGVTKTEYQATTVLVFGAINVLKLPAYTALGALTFDTLSAGLILMPFAVLGVWLGVVLHRRVSGRAFFALTYLLLTGAGIKLILDALT